MRPSRTHLTSDVGNTTEVQRVHGGGVVRSRHPLLPSMASIGQCRRRRHSPTTTHHYGRHVGYPLQDCTGRSRAKGEGEVPRITCGNPRVRCMAEDTNSTRWWWAAGTRTGPREFSLQPLPSFTCPEPSLRRGSVHTAEPAPRRGGSEIPRCSSKEQKPGTVPPPAWIQGGIPSPLYHNFMHLSCEKGKDCSRDERAKMSTRRAHADHCPTLF